MGKWEGGGMDVRRRRKDIGGVGRGRVNLRREREREGNMRKEMRK